ncbi:MAG: DUF3501 family protein [Thermoprotei archaeon]
MITEDQIMDWRTYEKIRSQKYQEISSYNLKRRVQLGDRLSLLFESSASVLHQIQEMVYLDKLDDRDKIRHEIGLYSTLIPCDGKVKGTLFISAYNENDLRRVFAELPGIYNCVSLNVGGRIIPGEPEAGRSQGAEFLTVQFLTFDLQGARSKDVTVKVDHPNYKASMKLSEALAKEIIEEAYAPC